MKYEAREVISILKNIASDVEDGVHRDIIYEGIMSTLDRIANDEKRYADFLSGLAAEARVKEKRMEAKYDNP